MPSAHETETRGSAVFSATRGTHPRRSARARLRAAVPPPDSRRIRARRGGARKAAIRRRRRRNRLRGRGPVRGKRGRKRTYTARLATRIPMRSQARAPRASRYFANKRACASKSRPLQLIPPVVLVRTPVADQGHPSNSLSGPREARRGGRIRHAARPEMAVPCGTGCSIVVSRRSRGTPRLAPHALPEPSPVSGTFSS